MVPLNLLELSCETSVVFSPIFTLSEIISSFLCHCIHIRGRLGIGTKKLADNRHCAQDETMKETNGDHASSSRACLPDITYPTKNTGDTFAIQICPLVHFQFTIMENSTFRAWMPHHWGMFRSHDFLDNAFAIFTLTMTCAVNPEPV